MNNTKIRLENIPNQPFLQKSLKVAHIIKKIINKVDKCGVIINNLKQKDLLCENKTHADFMFDISI